MSAGHIDTERLTQSVSGTVTLTDAESAHLAGCDECRLELHILTAAGRLGGAEIARVDLTRVAGDVRRRLHADEPMHVFRSRGRWLAGLAVAAIVALAVYTGMPRGTGPGLVSGAVVPVSSVLHELDELDVPELEEVLQSIPPATEAMNYLDIAPLADLDASDLERMLRSMEE